MEIKAYNTHANRAKLRRCEMSYIRADKVQSTAEALRAVQLDKTLDVALVERSGHSGHHTHVFVLDQATARLFMPETQRDLLPAPDYIHYLWVGPFEQVLERIKRFNAVQTEPVTS